MQLHPLQTPMEDRVENSAVPMELVLRVKEDFQKNPDMEAITEQYGETVVKQVLGRVQNEEPKKNTSDSELSSAIDMLTDDGEDSSRSISSIVDDLNDGGHSVTVGQIKALVQKLQARYKGSYRFKNAEPRDAHADFPVGTKVDMGHGETGKVTKVESSEAIWVKSDKDGQEVLIKLNKEPVKKLKNDETKKKTTEEPKKKNASFSKGDKVQVEGSGPVGIIEYVTPNNTAWVKIGSERHEYTFTELTKAK